MPKNHWKFFPAHLVQDTPDLDKTLPLKSFDLFRKFRSVQWSDKLKQLHYGRFPKTKMLPVFTYGLLATDGITFYLERHHSVPSYPQEPLLFPNIQSYNEQNPLKFHYSDTSDIIQIELNISHDTSEKDDLVFDEDSLCMSYYDSSILFDNETYRPLNVADDYQYPSRSESCS